MRATYLLPLVVLVLSSCQRAERLGCPNRDVAELARAEGARGLPASLPKADCQLDADELQRYNAAREQALQNYCKAQRGYQLGLDGKTADASACSEEGAKELQRGFAVGENLRNFLAQRDQILAKAQDAERLAARLPKQAPERRTLEDQAAGLRFDARQKENEVEALRGIVAVEKWR